MAEQVERLVYVITVTKPGSKSQGWNGVLYDKQGKPMQVEPGQTVKTPVGTFISVAPTNAWTPCGMIHADMVRWMKTEQGNVIMDSEPWSYHLYVAREGSKSEGWRGEWRHGRGIIPAPESGKPVETPTGPYVWRERANLWDPEGWFHVSWPQGHKAAHAA